MLWLFCLYHGWFSGYVSSCCKFVICHVYSFICLIGYPLSHLLYSISLEHIKCEMRYYNHSKDKSVIFQMIILYLLFMCTLEDMEGQSQVYVWLLTLGFTVKQYFGIVSLVLVHRSFFMVNYFSTCRRSFL